MVNYYCCQNELRLRLARTQLGVDGKYINGIDYLEVLSDPKNAILDVHLLHSLPPNTTLNQDNVTISDDIGTKITPKAAYGFGKLLTIKLEKLANPSPSYSLTLVESALELVKLGIFNPQEPSPPPQGFDPQLCKIKFALQSQESSDIDCQTQEISQDKPAPPPVIDYLAKDYASFRQLILDRLTVTMPQWKERSPADIGIMLVEILAYLGDHLSYYQDAVATEAYLGTARRRMSIRRHARLLDYFIHDGSNARAWVTVEITVPSTNTKLFNPKTDGIKILGASEQENRPGTRFLSYIQGLPTVLNPNQSQDKKLIIKAFLDQDVQVFESLHDITLYEPCNQIFFYTWGEEECRLNVGATKATLKDTGGKLKQCLAKGMVLIFEEYLNPNTGKTQGVDLTHRHAVRLLKVTPQEDPLILEEGENLGTNPPQKQRLLEIEWFTEDALPFALCISKRINGKLYGEITIARGNVVLVDHGLTRPYLANDFDLANDKFISEDNPLITSDNLEAAKDKANQDEEVLDEQNLNQVPSVRRYRPFLKNSNLTQQRYTLNQKGEWVLFDIDKPARDAPGWLSQDVYTSFPSREYNVYSQLATKEYQIQELARESLDQKRRWLRPSINLKEYSVQEFLWTYQRDLLNSDQFDRHFIVETEEDGRAYLRFGDDILGKRPDVGIYFQVTYRTGNGTIGNVGSEAIAHIIAELNDPNIRINKVRNPLPAQGGIDPEPIEQVRLYAPQAFRVPQRAVTEADYAKIAERYPGVQRVKATRRWTGSWHTIFLTVDRQDGLSLDHEFKEGLRAFLERFRLAGHDLEIESPRFVPLRISLKVQVKSDYFRNSVKQALLDTFSNRVLPNGLLGFFHPDRLTFGQEIYLSQVIKTAVEVEGVQSVEIIRFQRWGKQPQGEIKAGRISFDPLEIAQLNNEPANPNKGQIDFDMEGGL